MKSRYKHLKGKRKPSRPPLALNYRSDPSGTFALRRRFADEMGRVFNQAQAIFNEFNPNEPRLPAGETGGGEWTSGGAGSPTTDLGEGTAGKSRFFGLKKEAAHPVERVTDLPSLQRRLQNNEEYKKEADDFENKNHALYEKLAKDHGMTVPEYQKHVAQQAQKMVDGMDQYVRVPQSKIGQLLDSGRWKTVFETGASKGLADTKARDRVEGATMGIDHRIDPKFRPVSTYLSKDGFEGAGSEYADVYGKVMVKLKPEVRQRSTATFGDSLQNGSQHLGLASPLTKISHQSIDPAEIDYHGDKILDAKEYHNHKAFVETQVHGGLSLKDVEEIGFPHAPDELIQHQLRDKGIKWHVYGKATHNMLRFIRNLFGGKSKASRKVYRSDDGEHYIVIVGEQVTPHGTIQIGRLINVGSDSIGQEEPVDSIIRMMPWSDFQPYSGDLPPNVQTLLERNGLNDSQEGNNSSPQPVANAATHPCLDPKLWGKHLANAYRAGVLRAFNESHQSLEASVANSESAALLHGAREHFVNSAIRQHAGPVLNKVYDEYKRRCQAVLNSGTDPTRTQHCLATLARLSVVRASGEGQLDGYGMLGIERVRRVTDAGCSSHQGAIYNLAQARGTIPQHTTCRCAWLPAENVTTKPQQSALDAFSDLLHNYNPDQPRLPAGEAGGGQWSKEGQLQAALQRFREGNKPQTTAPHLPPTPASTKSYPKSNPLQAHVPGTEKISSEKVTDMEVIGGDTGNHVNKCYKVKFDDGTAGVWKPNRGEAGDLRSGVPNNTQYLREAATYAVAQVAGFADLVPPTTVREVNGEIGSMQVFVPDAKAAGKVIYKDRYDGEHDLKRAAVFDYLIGNTDRHNGNWLLTNHSKLVLIDHGLTFPTNYEDTFINRDVVEEAASHYSHGKHTNLSISADVVHLSEKWPDIEKALRAHNIEEPAIRLTKKRLDVLTRAAALGERFGDLPELWDRLGEDL